MTAFGHRFKWVAHEDRTRVKTEIRAQVLGNLFQNSLMSYDVLLLKNIRRNC